MLRAMLGGDFLRCRVRTRLTARSPQHDQRFLGKRLDTEHREIRWLNHVGVLQQFSLDFVQLVLGDANWRKDRLAVFVAVLANDDVAAAKILEVIGKRAQRADDRVRIPASLVFDPVTLNGPLPEQIFQIDREFGGSLQHSVFSLQGFFEAGEHFGEFFEFWNQLLEAVRRNNRDFSETENYPSLYRIVKRF